MATPREGLGEFVRQVRQSTQRYAKDLLDENEKLLSLATTLHAEKVRLEEQVESSRAANDENTELRAALDRSRKETTRLTQQLEGLRYQVDRQRALETSLMEQLAQMESANRDFSTRYLEVEQANSSLANLYVASYRIHGSLERAQVVATIHEVLVNLVGTEQFAIFERNADADRLVATSSFGIDGDSPPAAVVETLRSGETYLAQSTDAAEGEDRPVACIPLKVGADVRGVIAVFRLLDHKPQLEPVDLELFDLLATHAATALYCSDLHARLGQSGRGA
jgi:hypothetical protein